MPDQPLLLVYAAFAAILVTAIAVMIALLADVLS